MEKKIKIGTRKSALAMWQANYFKDFLEKANPGLVVELVKITTTGDRFLSRPLDDQASRETGIEKGFFTKELEESLLSGEIDAAIHSLKDLPTVLPQGLKLGAISQREEVSDIFISNHNLDGTIKIEGFDMPDLAPLSRKLNRKVIIGTASQRRIAQLGELFPQAQAGFVRGNVDTRIKKVIAGDFDAVMLAEAGLKRLQGKELFGSTLKSEIFWQTGEKEEKIFLYRLNPMVFMPACAQGFLGVEIRDNDPDVETIILGFQHSASALLATAERAYLRTLEAGCHAPVAGFAFFPEDRKFMFKGKILSKDGWKVMTGEKEWKADFANEVLEKNFPDFLGKAERLGIDLAEDLLQKGAGRLLG